MREHLFDEAAFGSGSPKLTGIESMVAVLVHKWGHAEKDLRNKKKFKDRAAILVVFRAELTKAKEAIGDA